MNGTLRSWDRYATRWAGLHGGMDPRDGSRLARGWLRFGYAAGRLGARLRIRPAAVTTAGLLLGVVVPVAAVRQGIWPVFGALLVLLAAVADTVDGAIAVVTDRVTRMGYVYDSVADRITEATWLIALWLVGAPSWLAVLCGALAWLHEYIRARAIAVGMTEIGAVTAGERPTRVILAVVGLALAGLSGLVADRLSAGTATVALALWLLFTLIGLIQLAAAVRAGLARRPG